MGRWKARALFDVVAVRVAVEVQNDIPKMNDGTIVLNLYIPLRGHDDLVVLVKIVVCAIFIDTVKYLAEHALEVPHVARSEDRSRDAHVLSIV